MSTAAAARPLQPVLIISFGFTALAIVCAARAAVGLMMPVWEADLGWSRSFISGGIAIALIMMALLAPFAGRLVDRQGSRNVLVAGLLILAAGCALLAVTNSAWVFVIALCGLSGIGFGLVATHVVSTAVEQQMDRNQGLGIGIATSGATAGQFLILPLVAVMMTTLSWRWSYVALALLSVALAAAIFWLLPRATPKTVAQAAVRKIDIRADLGLVLRKPVFHILFWSYFICGYTTSGVIEVHFIPYASFCGFTPVASATAFGILSGASGLGMIFAGWLTDRMNRPLLLGMIYLLRAVTFVLLVYVGADYQALLLFSVLFGIVDYSTVPVTASLVASHIGLRVMGLAFGLISAGHQIGGALGAYMGGYLFDLYAQYAWVWWSSLALAVLAGLMCFMIRERQTADLATAPA
ncbi:MAG: MFS transporter [Hyphomicrobium sp.]|uniref:MFS transporter n=1 Tax=Hyphomicrobium sp. TaxID=82 RepID=UPI003D0B411B